MMLPIKKISILPVSAVVSVEGWCFLVSATFSQNSSGPVEIREAILDDAEMSTLLTPCRSITASTSNSAKSLIIKAMIK